MRGLKDKKKPERSVKKEPQAMGPSSVKALGQELKEMPSLKFPGAEGSQCNWQRTGTE